MKERQEEAKGGARKHRGIALAHRAQNSPCDRRERGGLVFLALAAGSVARRLGDSAPGRPPGSPESVAEAPDAGVRLTARSDHQTQPGAPSPGIAKGKGKGAPGGDPPSSAIIAARYLRICVRVLGVWA